MSEDVAPPKRRGRPPAPEEKRRRHNLTLRIRAKLLEELERRAADNGRSLSEEAEAVLEKEYTRTTELVPLTINSDDNELSDRVEILSGKMQSWREYTAIVVHAQHSAIELFVRCKNDDLIEPLLRLMNDLSTCQLPEMHESIYGEYLEVVAEAYLAHLQKTDQHAEFTKEQLIQGMELNAKEDKIKRYKDFVFKSPTMSKAMKTKLDAANKKMLHDLREAYKEIDTTELLANDVPGFRAIYFEADKNDNPERQEKLIESYGFETANLIRGLERRLGHAIDDGIVYAAIEDKMEREMFAHLREYAKQNPGQTYELQPWNDKAYDAQKLFILKYGDRTAEMYERVRDRLKVRADNHR